eukprot:GHVU01228931.1.p1 GENE.GHVU01228931.1~~GHVU01228931.1.p1  ORF type:complete len:450 (+),score=64.47 GHVU01228931.1:75-1424(+)
MGRMFFRRSTAAAMEVDSRTCYEDNDPEIIHTTNADGLRLVSYLWLPPSSSTDTVSEGGCTVKGLSVLLHGITSHSRFEWLMHPCEGEEASSTVRSSTADNAADGGVANKGETISEDSQTMEKKKYVVRFKGSWVEHLTQNGYAVLALDLQGHGLSDGWEGVRCNVCKFDDFATDVVTVIDSVLSGQQLQDAPTGRPELPESVPVFLIGESLGGCIATRVAELVGDLSGSSDLKGAVKDGGGEAKEEEEGKQNDDAVVAPTKNRLNSIFRPAGVVLLAPALSVEKLKTKPVNRFLLPMASLLSRIAPHLPAAAKEPNLKYPHIEALLQLDPLTYKGKLRTRIAKETLWAVDQAHLDALSLGSTPMLVIHSSSDTMCDPEGSRRLTETLADTPDKQLIELEDMWHYLTKEPGTRKLMGTVTNWLDRYSGGISMAGGEEEAAGRTATPGGE